MLLAVLFLNRGRVGLTFSVGSGSVTLETPDVVVMKRQHLIKVHIQGRDATLQLEDKQAVIGSAPGPSQSLTMGYSTYIGGIPPTLKVSSDVPIMGGK